MSGKEEAQAATKPYVTEASLLSLSPYVKYVLIGEKGAVNISGGAVCFSQLGGTEFNATDGYVPCCTEEVLSIKPIKYLAFSCRKYMKLEYKDYIRWVVDESFYSRAFLSSFQECWEEGIAYMNIGETAQIVVGAMALLRSIFEHQSCIDLWNEGMGHGLGEDKSLVYAFSFQENFPMARYNINHSPVDFRDEQTVRSFLTGVPMSMNKVSFADNSGYKGFVSMFRNTGKKGNPSSKRVENQLGDGSASPRNDYFINWLKELK